MHVVGELGTRRTPAVLCNVTTDILLFSGSMDETHNGLRQLLQELDATFHIEIRPPTLSDNLDLAY